MGKFKKDVYTYTNFELSQSGFPCLQDDKESGNFKIFVYPVFLYT